jgi:hypothetical protein
MRGSIVTMVVVALSACGGAGEEGPQGPAGTDGVDGTDGIDGANGTDGRDGADGRDGRDASPRTKADLYEVTMVEPRGDLSASGWGVVIAYCDDADDILLNGGCPLPSSVTCCQGDGDVNNFEVVNAVDDTQPSGFLCRFEGGMVYGPVTATATCIDIHQ